MELEFNFLSGYGQGVSERPGDFACLEQILAVVPSRRAPGPQGQPTTAH